MHYFTNYILPFLLLLLAEVLYFKVALHFKIIDKPNVRSSHQVPTIRGGGIIFILGVVLFYFWQGYQLPYLLVALLVSGIVSFVDDIRTLPNWVKFAAHAVSVILIFRQCEMLFTLHPLYLLIIGILVIGVINAYNFMDGINGITGLYSLAIIVPLFVTEQDETTRSLQLFSIMALIVFNYFNTRVKAICFAGDVGSISMSILIVYLLIQRIGQTSDFNYIGMLLIYGIDSFYTILHRVIQKENIFKPHRKHLYQFLSNEKRMPQLLVSSIFAFLQFIVGLLIVSHYINLPALVVIFIALSLIYWFIKTPFLKLTRA